MEDVHWQVLFSVVDRLMPVSDHARQAFSDALSPVSFRKGDYLVRAGEENGGLYFVARGLVRFVYVTEDGREFNKSFASEGTFVGCLRSMLTRQCCRFAIQALEDSEMLLLPNQARLALYQRFPEWERLGRLLAEQLALKKEAREAELLLDSAETRYRHFLAEHPDLAERLPQYHIASYLGITHVALSRIRGKMQKDTSASD